MDANIMERVGSILREAAAVVIMSRFQTLLAGDVEEKSPGELVTVADRDVERIIGPQLEGLVPGSRVIGEEAVAANPSLLAGLDTGDVWLLDPLDGTANFVAGLPTFSVMVALLRQGTAVASWMLEPISGRLCEASLGSGAFVDGVRVHASASALAPSQCRGSVLTRFLPDDLKRVVVTNSAKMMQVLPGAKCAGIDYPSLVTGQQNFLMFWRLLPWDHAPGTLFVAEAGGHVARLDGSEYRPGDPSPGLLVAQNRDVWEIVTRTLLRS